ncbi:MAG: cation:proton antiporter [Sedimentisphaerales bacterium]|nr:cation:proton antiporter [Sedimentisphaerales bacterium]
MANILAEVPEQFSIHIGILLLLGIGVLGGALGAWFFQKIRVPQVVGYIVFGILIGKSGLKLLGDLDIEQLGAFTWFALGIIGFLVGGELQIKTFRQYGKQFINILLWEGITTFLLVGLICFGVVYLVTHNAMAALATGIVLGAIASATDPASTIEVLWEYRAKGILTTTIIAIIALDDALAMTLYGVGTSCAEMLLGNSGSILSQCAKVAFDLFGSIGFGLVSGLVLIALVRYLHQSNERILAISVGTLLVVIGISDAIEFDVILVTMSMGFLLVNLAPRYSEKLFKVVKSFSAPIYVMFFVLVGARLGVGNMPLWLWGIVGVYVLCRSAGKIFGCYMGAKLSGAPITVQKYSGLGIFAQGGVAIGLSIMASHHMGHIAVTDDLSLGEVIIAGVTTTTMFVQILGPSLTKLSVKLGGELGCDITEDDLMKTYKVQNVMEVECDKIPQDTRIKELLYAFSVSDSLFYPVVDSEERLMGIITIDGIKRTFAHQRTAEWLLAHDVMEEVPDKVDPNMPLAEAMELMDRAQLDNLPVVDKASRMLKGVLSRRSVKRKLGAEVLRRGEAVG